MISPLREGENVGPTKERLSLALTALEIIEENPELSFKHTMGIKRDALQRLAEIIVVAQELKARIQEIPD